MLCTLNLAGPGFRLESPVPLDLHPHYTPYLYESKEPDVRIRILTDAPDYPAGAPAFSSGRLAVYPTEYGWFRELYAQTTMNTWDSAQSALLCDELTALTGSFPVLRLDCRLGPEGAALCAGSDAERGLAVSFQLIPQARRSAGRRLPGRGRAEADRAEARTALIVQRSAAQKMCGKR